MDKTLNQLTQWLAFLVIMLLAFMLGFNTSYKYNHLHVLIDFLIKCYIWLFDWLGESIKKTWGLLHLNPSLFTRYDEQFAQFFAGFVFLFAFFLLLQTWIITIANLISRSARRS